MTYAEMSAAVSRYANALGVLGVEPGDRVTVQIEKSVSGVLLYLAVMKAGAIYQPLNTAYTEAEVDYFVGDAEPKLIVCDPARQQRLRAIADAHKVFAVVNLDGRGEGSLAALAGQMDERHDTAERIGRGSGRAALHLRHHRTVEGCHDHPRQPARRMPRPW